MNHRQAQSLQIQHPDGRLPGRHPIFVSQASVRGLEPRLQRPIGRRVIIQRVMVEWFQMRHAGRLAAGQPQRHRRQQKHQTQPARTGFRGRPAL